MQASSLIFPTRVQDPQQRRKQERQRRQQDQQRRQEQRKPQPVGSSRSRRRVLGVLSAVLATFALCSCEMVEAVADNMFTLTVVNRCTGPNYTVAVSVNGVDVGSVTYSGTFIIFTGPITLRAVGTGANGHVFENSTYVTGDLRWTLCPPRQSSSASSGAEARLDD